jgi:hypothetical protein
MEVLKEMEAGTSTGLDQAVALNGYLAKSCGFMVDMAARSRFGASLSKFLLHNTRCQSGIQ